MEEREEKETIDARDSEETKEKNADVQIQDEKENLLNQLEEKEKIIQDYKERWLRALADYDNFRKRMEKEIKEVNLYAGEQLIKDILPILDNFERALKSAENDLNSTIEGIKLIYNQLKNLLSKYGVAEIEAEGKPFDPYYHEAVMQVQNPEYDDNIVLEVLQKGYTFHSRVIRPCLVKVVKNN
ncbi:nucleotide exchange factor GrpE [Thermovenabulum sp.]|uniref:nucleotide exchange factor GrpE n=1 Tax=Thermovenabulum sp. TaxID=3100335 RepID=UPI003C7CFEE8